MSCDVECLRCKNFIFKLMLNGYDGVCEKHNAFTKFKYKCDDFSYGRNKIYEEKGDNRAVNRC